MRGLRSLSLVLVLAAACHAPATTSGSTSGATSTATSNRDKHGPPDVGDYIEKLQSNERVADLQVDTVIGKLKLSADACIGDLGCGPGVFTMAFSKACPRGVVYAADVEPRELDQVNAKVAAQGARNVVPRKNFPRQRLRAPSCGVGQAGCPLGACAGCAPYSHNRPHRQ